MTTARQASLSNTNSWSWPKPMSIELVMSSNYLIFCHPLLLLPSVFPNISIFSNESVLHIRWPKYWSFTFQWTINQDWSAVVSLCSPRDSQESSPTPQFKSIKFSALSFLHSQLSHPYMTTGKTIALTSQTFVGKVMSLLFNMLSRLVITFLPRSKCLLNDDLGCQVLVLSVRFSSH